MTEMDEVWCQCGHLDSEHLHGEYQCMVSSCGCDMMEVWEEEY